jgi:[ribosomal protein S5]-alanine N-acetyltransferase
MDASLRTPRLHLVPLTLPQLRLCLTDLPALEVGLGLSISRDVLTDRVRGAIRKKIEKMTGMEESHHPWQTYWLIIINENNFGAGLAGFKGYPDESGSSEIRFARGSRRRRWKIPLRAACSKSSVRGCLLKTSYLPPGSL